MRVMSRSQAIVEEVVVVGVVNEEPSSLLGAVALVLRRTSFKKQLRSPRRL
jgi:hypothetical protein